MGKHDVDTARTIKFYDENANDYIERTRDLDLSVQRNRFLSYLPGNSTILDVGCGSGRDIKEFSSMGYSVVGIDASHSLIEFARKYTKEKCLELSYDDISWVEEFDGIWACASLLHVKKLEMEKLLNRLCRALKRGGVLYVSLREGEDEKVLPDGRYFSNYTSEEFFKIIESGHCMRVIESWTTPDLSGDRPDITWLNFIVKRLEKTMNNYEA
ncbi:MAG: class I SAM-dependent methyltransferase [Candidatus Thiodiazotropha sp.]